jgi:hypothetical protein
MKKDVLLKEFDHHLKVLTGDLTAARMTSFNFDEESEGPTENMFNMGQGGEQEPERNLEVVLTSLSNAKKIFEATLAEDREHDYSGSELLTQLMSFRNAIDSATAAKQMTAKVAAASKVTFAQTMRSLYQSEKTVAENTSGHLEQLTKKALREKFVRELVVGLGVKNIIAIPSVPNCLQAFNDVFNAFGENQLINAVDIQSLLSSFEKNINDRLTLGFKESAGISGSPAYFAKDILNKISKNLLAPASLGTSVVQDTKQAVEPVQGEALAMFTAFKTELDKLKPSLLTQQTRLQDIKAVNDSFQNAYDQFQAFLNSKPKNSDVSSYMHAQIPRFNEKIDAENSDRRMTGRVAGAAKAAFAEVFVQGVSKKDEALEKLCAAFDAELQRLEPTLLSEQKNQRDKQVVNSSFAHARTQFKQTLEDTPEDADRDAQISRFNEKIDAENKDRRMTGRVASAAKRAFKTVQTLDVAKDFTLARKNKATR